MDLATAIEPFKPSVPRDHGIKLSVEEQIERINRLNLAESGRRLPQDYTSRLERGECGRCGDPMDGEDAGKARCRSCVVKQHINYASHKRRQEKL